MEITIQEEKYNPFLKRKELKILVRHENEATPSKETIKKEYNLVGPKEYTYNEFIDAFAKAIGKRNYIKIYIPIWLIRVSSAILGNLSPITKEQLELLLQGSTYEFDDLKGTPIKNIPIDEELKNI